MVALYIFIAVLIINFLLFLSMIFLERKKPASIISWMTVLTVLPVVGFMFYLWLGSGLSVRIRHRLNRYKFSEQDYVSSIDGIERIKNYSLDSNLLEYEEIIKCVYNEGGMFCPNNDVKIFTDGLSKIEALKTDLENAKESINMQYYIFADDHVGKEIMSILIRKAKEGVKVKLIYDSIGCLGAPRRFFRKLKKAGGQVCEFFPPFLRIRLIDFKLNYRNHKKIVVIDGKIGYTGGINIRDDHMGRKKKVSPWRDTHLRIEGYGVYALQNLFLNDYRYCKKDKTLPEEYVKNGYFPAVDTNSDACVQIVTSGPDLQLQNIKECYIKLITTAKKSVYIQSPYFIPDDSFMTAVRLAIASGVDVRIMAPGKPDKRTVYFATLSYLQEFAEMGVSIYLYDGFLHSKMLVIDDTIVSIGTCNIDNRSFSLNFEDTAIVYSHKFGEECAEIFKSDIKNSQLVDINYFRKKKIFNKFLQAIFRLFSPIL